MNKLMLNKSLFAKHALLTGIAAFKGICTIDYTESGDYYCCIFLNCIYDIDITKKEFENYIIDLINTSYDDN